MQRLNAPPFIMKRINYKICNQCLPLLFQSVNPLQLSTQGAALGKVPTGPSVRIVAVKTIREGR